MVIHRILGAEPFTAAVLDIVKAADPNTIAHLRFFRQCRALPQASSKQSLTAILDAATMTLPA